MDQRKENREWCYGKLLFLDSETPGYLRDISHQGMRIDVPFPFHPAVEVQKAYSIRIIPEEEALFDPFLAEVEIRWIRVEPPFTHLGAKLLRLEPGKEKAYENLLSLYKSHSSEEG